MSKARFVMVHGNRATVPSDAINIPLTVGKDGTGYDVKFFGDTSGSYMLWDESADYLQLVNSELQMALASSDASSTVRMANIVHTQGALTTGVIEALRVSVGSEYRTGSWANAIVARIDYGTTGDSAGGMAAALCAEMNLPAKDMHTLGGGYYCVDCEINLPTNCVPNTGAPEDYPVAFLNLAAWGGAVGQFDDYGFVFRTDGLTAASGHLLGAGSISLRANIEGTDKYLPLMAAEGCDLSLIGGGTNGIAFSGAYSTHALNFDSVTLSSTLIGVGSYGSPVEQSCTTGFANFCSTSDDADSWRYGMGIYTKGTGSGTKLFGIGLQQEYNGTAGVDRMQCISAIALLGGGGEAGRLKTLGGDGTAGMHSGWFKVGANTNCVVDSGSRVAPLWIDNQMNCVCSGEEYAMFITCGGSKVDAVMGFETTSSGWSNFLSFDETAYDQDPVSANGCNVSGAGASEAYLKVNLNGSAYGIPLIAI